MNSLIFFEIGGNWLIREIGLGETSWAFRFIDRQPLIMTRMNFVCVTHFQFWSNYKSIVEIKKDFEVVFVVLNFWSIFQNCFSQKFDSRHTHEILLPFFIFFLFFLFFILLFSRRRMRLRHLAISAWLFFFFFGLFNFFFFRFTLFFFSFFFFRGSHCIPSSFYSTRPSGALYLGHDL